MLKLSSSYMKVILATAIILILAATLSASAMAGSRSPSSEAVPLSITVSGNHFVNGSGQMVRLVGVNRSSTEYACIDWGGYASGSLDASDAAVIAGWHANAVRIPLNEDCWLGI